MVSDSPQCARGQLCNLAKAGWLPNLLVSFERANPWYNRLNLHRLRAG